MGSGATCALAHLKVEEMHVVRSDLVCCRAGGPAGIRLNAKLVIILAVLRAKTRPLFLRISLVSLVSLVRHLSLRAALEVVTNGRGCGVRIEVVRRVREALPDLR